MQHTALLPLPDMLRSQGVRCVDMAGWDTAQGSYYWQDAGSYALPPECFMVHHTGTTSARPVVKSSSGQWSKANAWLGIERDGVLYSSGAGTPAVYLTSAGPARTSAGYGHWPDGAAAMNDTKTAPCRATGPDGGLALNRWAFSVEVVHPGDSSALHPAVHHALAVLGAQLHLLLGWQERVIGHAGWTTRKIDPYWDGERCCIDAVRSAVLELMTGADDMDLETWASTLRNPLDFDRMAQVGIITDAERDYWVTVPAGDPEMQDLRDAVQVRSQLWT